VSFLSGDVHRRTAGLVCPIEDERDCKVPNPSTIASAKPCFFYNL
jgi:hypothetical protein